MQPHIPLQAFGLALHAGLPTAMAAAITQTFIETVYMFDIWRQPLQWVAPREMEGRRPAMERGVA